MANQSTKSSSSPSQQTKKRRRSTASTSSGSTSRKKKTNPSSSTTTAPSIQRTTPPPTKILIIDNGGHTIKFGWAANKNNNTNNKHENSDQVKVDKDDVPMTMPNVTARLQHQWTVLVGDEITHVQNPNSLIGITRSTERGIIVNLGNQTQVWKRVLDQVGVIVSQTTEAAQSLGWSGKIASRSNSATQPKTKPTILPHTIAVFLLLPPHCPRVILDQITTVWMEDFGVSHVGFGISGVVATATPSEHEHSTCHCSCVVDMGWSATHIVPTYRYKPVEPTAIRRIPLGARHLVNMLKYYMSYRQWNLMDQEFLLKHVMEELCYLSLEFEMELKQARQIPSGRRPYDRDYVLPDYQSTFHGKVKLPIALQKYQELQKRIADSNQQMEEDEDDEDDDSEVGSDGEEGDNKQDDEDDDDDDNDDDKKNNDDNDDDDNDDSDREETVEELRRRALKQAAEEERRKREKEEEEQLLRVSVERFTVPEVLFRPFDAGLQPDLIGLPLAIVQSIKACPKPYHPALYRSIYITGGLCQLPNLKQRLEYELRSIVPCEYTINVTIAKSPLTQAWLGANEYVQKTPYTQWSISWEEWLASSKKKAYTRLLLSNGGIYV